MVKQAYVAVINRAVINVTKPRKQSQQHRATMRSMHAASRPKLTKEAEPTEDGTGSPVARSARVVTDRIRNTREDPGGRDGGSELWEEEAVEEGKEGEAGKVLEGVLVNSLGAAVAITPRARM